MLLLWTNNHNSGLSFIPVGRPRPEPQPPIHNRSHWNIGVIMNSCSAQTVMLSDDWTSKVRGGLGLARAERGEHWKHFNHDCKYGIRLAGQYSLSMLVFCRTRHGRVDKVFNFTSLSLWLTRFKSWPFLIVTMWERLFQCDLLWIGVRPRDGGMSNGHDILMAGAPASASQQE